MIRGRGVEGQFFYLYRLNLMRYITLVHKAMSRYACLHTKDFVY